MNRYQTPKNHRNSQDWYEISMAQANHDNDDFGRLSSFQVVNRRMPKTKQVGTFKHNGETYNELKRRNYIVNAGTRQALSILSQNPKDDNFQAYLQSVQDVNEDIAEFVATKQFSGDVYAPKEGEMLFPHEPQLQVNAGFETAQLYESALLQTINAQTHTATAANDIAQLTDKLLLEGASRRARGAEHSMNVTRAALIGGFDATSNVAYGHEHDMGVGGTHGHSYVMVKSDELTAFDEQAYLHGNDTCFLLDTYDVDKALDKAFNVAGSHGLDEFAVRLDSGDLAEQAKQVRQEAKRRGRDPNSIEIVISDGLDPNTVRDLEAQDVEADTYLIGTYLAQPPGRTEAVYKLQAYQDQDGEWRDQGKLSSTQGKETLPGEKQVWRLIEKDGYFARDIIAKQDEPIEPLLKDNEVDAKPLLHKVMHQGKLQNSGEGRSLLEPNVDSLQTYRERQLERFKELSNYSVDLSPAIQTVQRQLREQYGKHGRQ